MNYATLHLGSLKVSVAVLSITSTYDDDYLAQVAGEAGKRYVLEKSFDLRNWTPVSTNTGSFTWADKDTTLDLGEIV